MMAATTLCPSPHAIEQKSRIKITGDTAVSRSITLVRGYTCHKTRAMFTGSGYHVTNRTSQASGLITGVFTRCRPRTANHQPTGITHMTLTNRDKRPPDTGAVQAHLRGLLKVHGQKGSRHCCIRPSAYSPPAAYTPAAASDARRAGRADASRGRQPPRR